MFLTVPQQQNHISKLLNTAATGTGVVGDVDALLAPIEMTSVLRTESKPERNLWREDEMLQMLNFMHSTNALELLNDKTVKSEKVFRNVERLMNNCGYRKKSYMQIWTKWKFLKSTYMTSSRAGVIPKVVPFKIYQVLHKILSNSGANGTANSSVDGDNSDGGQLIISSIESGCLTNGKDVQDNLNEISPDNDKDADDESGLAHPIFGFRLGLVKEEPQEADFETSNNINIITDDPLDETNPNSSCSSAVNTHFQAEVKQEVFDDSDSSLQHYQKNKQDSREEIMREISSAPKLPPLRIAPFAKVPMHSDSSQQQQNRQPIMSRSPPPLSMHSVQPQQQPQQVNHRHYTRQNQVQTISNNNSSNNNKRTPNNLRMLLPKPTQAQQQNHTSPATAPIRIPKDITIHQTRTLSSTPTMPRLKPMAIRSMESYHPQRIETVLPDSDSQIILQQQKQQYAINFINNGGASTSQHAAGGRMFTSAQMNQKRRLQSPYTTQPTKLAKTYVNIKQSPVVNEANFYPGDEDVEGDDDDSDQEDNLSMLEPMEQTFPHAKLLQEQQQQQFRQYQQQQKVKKAKKLKKEEESFEASLRGLGKSLRSIQRELIDEFFEKQMQLAREEHEFQSKQDALLMEAFEEQAELILKSAKKLLGIDLPGIKSTNKNVNQTETKGESNDVPKTQVGDKNEETNEQDEGGEVDENEEENQEIFAVDDDETNMEDDDDDDDDDEDDDGEDDDDDKESENLLGDPIEMVSSELFEAS